ncbi:3-oxoacyl-ACP reductase [Thalassotalea sp. PLHSN55]|uniref:3-oxoacyl-ACP reductase n=1 Tax=Thalassotalea sp. PLHSN55 TaxID=3435888 RepID=UPI003F84C6A9
MPDRYLTFSQSAFGKKLLPLIGLPMPANLIRVGGSPETLVDNILLVDAKTNTNEKEADSLLHDILQGHLTTNANAQQIGGLVVDATWLTKVADTDWLYQVFHDNIRSIKASGKIVLLARSPETCQDYQQASVQRGLIGFIKSIAKEVGRKGITANVIYTDNITNGYLAAPLRFYLSYRSAYVNGQVTQVSEQSVTQQSQGEHIATWHQPLAGKVALVTGASRGIGAAIAKVLARDGAKVIGLDIPQLQSELNVTMSALNGDSLCVNITDENAVDLIAQHITEHYGAIDIVVHNAGITRDKTLARMSKAHWQQVMQVNLQSVIEINEHLLKQQCINQGGRILCVSSISGIAGNLGQSNYALSKASIIGLIENQAKLLALQGITINAVAPGFIETQMTAAIPLLTRFVGRRMSALSQGGLPEDVAESIAFLAAPQAQGISANLIRVCGLNMMGA